MFRKALLLLSSNVLVSVLSLARNLLVARLIPLEDYGVAATFAVILALIQMSSQLGLQQQIVQSKDGDDPHFQAGLQGFHLLRSVLAFGLLLLLGGVFADLMGQPQAALAYHVLAFVPLLRAMQHFDMPRMNRQMNFLPGVMVRTVPMIITLALTWPLAVWLNDYWVMLYLILIQSALSAALSHFFAERRWRVVFDRKIIAGSVKFGWPLLTNNILLFLVFNGDRIIISRELGASTLAIFSMGLTLTLTPTLVFARSAQSFFLPQLSKLDVKGAGRERFRQLASVVIELVLLASLVFTLGVTLVGGPIVLFLLGEKYAPLLPFLNLFAISQGLRMLKIGPAIVALSVGRTGNAMIGNSLRLVTLPLVWWVAVTTGDLRVILLLMVAGELAGCALALGILWWHAPLRRGELVITHLMAIPLFGTVTYLSFTPAGLGELPAIGGWTGLPLILILLPSVLGMRALFGYLLPKLKR